MNLENFLNDQFPLSLQTHVVSALKNAYHATDRLISDVPFLQVKSARFNHGRLKSWAADYYIEGHLKTGLLPYGYQWDYYGKPTGQFLRINLPEAKLIVSQVLHPNQLPRFANFRANAVLSNQPFLFAEYEKERNEDLGKPTFILTHGHKDLSFVRIGLPNPDQHGYIFQTQNLLNLPHIMESVNPKPEAIDAEGLVTLKEELFKRLGISNA